MDPFRWLTAQGFPQLAEILSEKADVFTMNDLAVRVWQEETHPSEHPELIPASVKAAYKEAFPETTAPYAGSSLEDLYTSFHKLTGGCALLSSAGLSENMVHLGQGVSLKEIVHVLENLDGSTHGNEASPVQLKKDAQISFVEYCRYMRFKLGGRKPPSIKRALLKLFRHYDRDNNGVLDLTEVKKLLKTLNLSEIEATTLIKQADTDSDGTLSFDEIYKHTKAADHGPGSPWKVLKLWLQLSSGWEVAPKDPEEEARVRSQHPNSKIVTFIRHGQSEGNLAANTTGSAKGWFNPHITPLGVEQAVAQGKTLLDHKFDLIVVSPMKRTLETYKHCIGEGINKDVRVIGHPLAREQFSESDDVGDKPALIKAAWPQVEWNLFPDHPEVWWYPGPDYSPEEAANLTVEAQREKSLKDDWEEPWAELMQRAADFESWLYQQPEKEICVFSHGGFIEALVGPRMDNAQRCILRVDH